jgi:hypothetical protein
LCKQKLVKKKKRKKIKKNLFDWVNVSKDIPKSSTLLIAAEAQECGLMSPKRNATHHRKELLGHPTSIVPRDTGQDPVGWVHNYQSN